MSAVTVVLSGGLDSSTLLHYVHDVLEPKADIHSISFDYGQKHKKELEYAQYQAEMCSVEHRLVDLSSITELLAASGTSLLDPNEEVPEGHYAAENMKSTVVPNRNMIMASIAAGWAIANGSHALYLGVHGGDHFIYPDCRPPFIAALNAAIVRGNAGFGQVAAYNEDPMLIPDQFVKTPFIDKTKTDIASLAGNLMLEIDRTWSCYKGGDIHCGKCGTCVERIEALEQASVYDPTIYQEEQ
jgi:7-cyano-7-deazaguanine synthase